MVRADNRGSRQSLYDYFSPLKLTGDFIPHLSVEELDCFGHRRKKENAIGVREIAKALEQIDNYLEVARDADNRYCC